MEKGYFSGDRIYINTIELSYVIYSKSNTAEIQALGDSKDLEIYFEPGIDLDKQSTEWMVIKFLRLPKYLQENDTDIQMEFIELPTGQIQVESEG